MTTPHDFVNAWVGTPYVVGGRDRTGADCWGLALAYYRACLGVELPDWRLADGAAPGDDMDGFLARAAAAIANAERETDRDATAVRLEQPEDHAVIVCHRLRGASHVGVVVPGGRVLHTTERLGAVCEPLAAFARNFPRFTCWRWIGPR